jgi:DNA-binding NarL/FixJ family response regulator
MIRQASAGPAADGIGDGVSTLLLVDDHPLYHAGLQSVLRTLRPNFRVLSAPDAAAGLAVLQAEPGIDLVLVDIVLPGTDGFDAVAEYGRACPHIPRILISGREDPATLHRASRSGASGFVAKSWPVDRLVAVIEQVLAGNSGFDRPPAASDARGGQSLSLRQIEVLCLLAQGKSNKEIARCLDIADRTVRAHLTELFHALGVASRVQAVLQAQQLGIVT